MRLLGALLLIFAGSFAASVMTFDWPNGSRAAVFPAATNAVLPGAGGLLYRTPVMRLAASSANATPPAHR